MKLECDKVALLVIDIQSKLLSVVYDSELLVGNIRKMIQGVQVLDIPVVLTEQYPKGIGYTVGEIKEVIEIYSPIEKRSFSCCGDANFNKNLSCLNRKQILVCGIEAHVCVYQTCLDLLDAGYEVHLLTDAISSRKKENCDLAISKLQHIGINLTSVEMALFEILQDSNSDEFKKISRIIK